MDNSKPHITGSSENLSFRAASIFTILFIVALIPIISTPVLPLIDFYNHLARYFVLSHVEHSEFLKENYASNWSILPNIGMDVIGTLLLSMFPPLMSAKILAILIFATIYSGALYLNRQISGSWSPLVAILLVPLLYSYIFIWGFANFLFGLGLALWSAGWWLRTRHRLVLALPVAAALAVLIFLAHGLAFALYGILVGALELGLFLASADRRLGVAAKYFVALALQALVPAIMFISTTTAKAQTGLTNADESVRRLLDNNELVERIAELLRYRLQTIVRVAEGPNIWFDILTLSATAGLVLALTANGRIRFTPMTWPAIGLAAILVIVTPPALFGVGYVADRMPLFLALIIVASITPQLRRDGFERICIAAILALTVIRIGYITYDWQKYRRDFAEFRAISEAIPPQSLVTGFSISLKEHVDTAPRCEMYGPLLIAIGGQAGPLFANATQQPLRLVGDLRKGADAMPRAGALSDLDAPTFFTRYINAAHAAGYYQYMLICKAERLQEPLPPGAAVVAKTNRFTLVRLHP